MVLPTVGLPFHISRQSKKFSTASPTGQSDGGAFSTDVPSSQMTLTCTKLTKPKHHMMSIEWSSSFISVAVIQHWEHKQLR